MDRILIGGKVLARSRTWLATWTSGECFKWPNVVTSSSRSSFRCPRSSSVALCRVLVVFCGASVQRRPIKPSKELNGGSVRVERRRTLTWTLGKYVCSVKIPNHYWPESLEGHSQSAQVFGTKDMCFACQEDPASAKKVVFCICRDSVQCQKPSSSSFSVSSI